MNPRVPNAMHQNTTNVTRIKKKSQNESKSLFLNSAIVSFKPSLKAFIINPLLYIKHESLDLFTASIEC